MIHPLAVLKVVQTAAVVRHLVYHALPLGVGAGTGQLHAHLVHEILLVVLVQLGRLLADETLGVNVVSHGPRSCATRMGFLTPEMAPTLPKRRLEPIRPASIFTDPDSVRSEPGVSFPSVLHHHCGLDGGVCCAAPQPQNIDPSLAWQAAAQILILGYILDDN